MNEWDCGLRCWSGRWKRGVLGIRKFVWQGCAHPSGFLRWDENWQHSIQGALDVMKWVKVNGGSSGKYALMLPQGGNLRYWNGPERMDGCGMRRSTKMAAKKGHEELLNGQWNMDPQCMEMWSELQWKREILNWFNGFKKIVLYGNLRFGGFAVSLREWMSFQS